MKTETKNLGNGTMNIITKGATNIRIYGTGDAMQDQVIVVDKGGKGVVIELPAFHDNIKEITQYLESEGIEIIGKLVAYHAAGSSFLPDVRNYLTPSAMRYNAEGQGAMLVGNFARAFGEAFDDGTVVTGEELEAGRIILAGITFEIIPNGDAFEVLIPEMGAVYIHMLGHDCHSIVANATHADAIIAGLRGYLDRGVEIFLSSHYAPETRNDVLTKIAYLEDLKGIAASSSGAEEFKRRMSESYPGYSGMNYLEMTAGMFFPQ